MSQTATVLVDDVSAKQGETNGKAWTRYALKDGNGDWYSTFEKDVVKSEMKGQRVEIEWEKNGNFNNLLRATPTEESHTPPLGTGEYVKGKEAPSTQRAISAAVALQWATTWCLGIPEKDVINENGVLLVANKYFDWLMARAEGNAVAGPTTSPSSEEIPL